MIKVKITEWSEKGFDPGVYEENVEVIFNIKWRAHYPVSPYYISKQDPICQSLLIDLDSLIEKYKVYIVPEIEFRR